MKTIKNTILLFLIALPFLTNAQTADLYYQIKDNLKTESMRAFLPQLRQHVISGKSSKKKRTALALENQASTFISECNLAYARTEKIINKLEQDNQTDLIYKVKKLQSAISGMRYNSNKLIKYCGWIIKNPRRENRIAFNAIKKSFNHIIEKRNALSKSKNVLDDVVAWESYISIKNR